MPRGKLRGGFATQLLDRKGFREQRPAPEQLSIRGMASRYWRLSPARTAHSMRQRAVPYALSPARSEFRCPVTYILPSKASVGHAEYLGAAKVDAVGFWA